MLSLSSLSAGSSFWLIEPTTGALGGCSENMKEHFEKMKKSQ